MSRGIIPKLRNGRKMYIWKWISFFDLSWTAAVIILDILIGSTLPGTTIIKIVSCTFLLTILLFPLFPINTKDERIYNSLINLFKFLASVKKYKYGGKNDSISLMPYEKFLDNETLVLKDTNKDGKYVKVIGVKGFDIYTLTEDDRNNKLNRFQRILLNLQSNISVIKTEEIVNLEDNINYLNNLIKGMDLNIPYNVKRKKSILSELKRLKKIHSGQITTVSCFYFCIFNSKIDDLVFENNNIINSFRNIGLEVWNEKENKITDLICTINGSQTKYSGLPDGDLDEIFAHNEVLIKGDFIRMNGATNYIYRNTSVIEDQDVFPDLSWMYDIASSCSTVFFKIKNTYPKYVEKKINKTISNLKLKNNSISSSLYTEKAKLEDEISNYDFVLNEVANRNEKFVSINTYIINYATTLDELSDIIKVQFNDLKIKGYKANKLLFRQYEGYLSTHLNDRDYLTNHFSNITTTRTIAEGWFALSRGVSDTRGVLLGLNNYGDYIVFDQMKNVLGTDASLANANMWIMGKAGMGKSTIATAIVNHHIVCGRNVFIFDNEGEYKKMCKYYGGSYVDVGGADSTKFNPLQILTTWEEEEFQEEQKNNKNLIKMHLMLLEQFFKSIFPDLNEREIRVLNKLLQDFYYEWFKNIKKQLNKISEEEFPIIEQFVNWSKKQIAKITDDSFLNKKIIAADIIEAIEDELVLGKYSEVYNGHTTMKLNDSKFVVFGTQSLFLVNDKKLIDSQFILMMAFLQNQMLLNGYYQQSESIIFIDEAHLLVNERYPVVLEFVSKTVKRCRKRNTGIILATQNPKDFISDKADVSKHTEAIITNSQYSIILGVNSTDATFINKMYERQGGLTDDQYETLINCDRGAGLFMRKENERYKMEFLPNELVLEFVDKKKKEVDEKKF